MARRGDGVRQHEDGYWEGRFSHNGRRISVRGKTHAEALSKLHAARAQALTGIVQPTGRQTVSEYLDEWLETVIRPNRRPRTYESYRETVGRYIRPAIGRVQLTKLTPQDVRRMVNELTARGTLSATTVRYAYAVLRIALGRALKDEAVVRNVATLIDAPTKVRSRMEPLSVEQVQAFLEAIAGDPLEALYVVAIGSGMRQGELLALRWSDVSPDMSRLTVRHTLQRGTRQLAAPKTEQSRRSVELPAFASEALRRHRASQLEAKMAARRKWQDLDYVFVAEHGQPLDGVNVTHRFQAAVQRAGLPHQRFHDLRHACVTLMLQTGTDIAVISKAIGHSNVRTTVDIYAHLTTPMQREAASRLDGLLTRRGAASG